MTLADRTSSSVDDNHVFPPAWLRVQNDILGNKLLCPFRGHRQPPIIILKLCYMRFERCSLLETGILFFIIMDG